MSIDELLERLDTVSDWWRAPGRDAAQAAATIRALREALESIMSYLDHGRNAPGHGHNVPGVWDDDISNRDKAGEAGSATGNPQS